MALDARRRYGGACRRLDSPGVAQYRGNLEAWTVHVHEHASVARSAVSWKESDLGDASAWRLHRSRARPSGARIRHQAAMDFLSEWREKLGNCAGPALHGHGCRGSHENMEQHAPGNESRTAPATAAQGAHGRADRAN